MQTLQFAPFIQDPVMCMGLWEFPVGQEEGGGGESFKETVHLAVGKLNFFFKY